MRGSLRWLALGLALAAGAAPAQQETRAAGGVAAGPGTVRGRVLREARPDAVGGLEVALYALSNTGSPGVDQTVSAEDGSFAFEGVSNDPTIVYLVGARSGGVPFGARVAFTGGERSVEVELHVLETTADAAGALAGDSVLRVEQSCSGIRITEVHELRNPTERVIYVPPAERGSRAAILRGELPAQASSFEVPLGVPPEGLERNGTSLRFWGPLYPGTQQLEFGYDLPAVGDRVAWRRGFPDGAERVLLLADEQGPELRGERLSATDGPTLEGRRQRGVEALGLAPGEAIDVSLEIDAPQREALSTPSAQFWLELDEAALTVDQQVSLRVEGDEPLVAGDAAPLLCLTLPDGAEGIRFASATLELGLTTDPSGDLAVRGPIPAGDSVIALRYRLPVRGEPVRFTPGFSRPVALLSLFVADTGIVVEAARLHRRRPVRNGERSHFYLEGFGIEPGEPVEIFFERLPAHRPLPRLAVFGFALLAAAGAIAFLTAPLRARRGATAAAPPAISRLAEEREALYSAIRDLDDDLETGKLTEQDHAQLQRELRAGAVQLLREEREAARAAPEPGPATSCPRCGETPPEAARFCPQCGTPLASEAGAG
jgi:hypothetical protein